MDCQKKLTVKSFFLSTVKKEREHDFVKTSVWDMFSILRKNRYF